MNSVQRHDRLQTAYAEYSLAQVRGYSARLVKLFDTCRPGGKMHFGTSHVLAACTAVLLQATAAYAADRAPPTYSVVNLSTPGSAPVGGQFGLLGAISPSGLIILNEVDGHIAASGTRYPSYGSLLRWVGKPPAGPAPRPGGHPFLAIAINDRGEMAGSTYRVGKVLSERPAVVRDGSLRDFEPTGSSDFLSTGQFNIGFLLSINRLGRAVGYANSSPPGNIPPIQLPLLHCPEIADVIRLPSPRGGRAFGSARHISDQGLVVGDYLIDESRFPVAWQVRGDCRQIADARVLSAAPGIAYSSNESGAVVGCGYHTIRSTTEKTLSVASLSRPLKWHDGAESLLSTLPNYDSSCAIYINSAGLIVGIAEKSFSPAMTIAIWDSEGRVWDLFERSDAKQKGVTKFIRIHGLSEAGNILVSAMIAGQYSMLLLTSSN